MNIKVQRKWKKEKYTVGEMYINGEYLCNTLEDTERVLNKPTDKIPGETAIPKGKYRVNLTYSDKFKIYLPLLENVPYFTAIRIHQGNTPNDSMGCILVGKNTKPGWLSESRATLRLLLDKIKLAINKNEPIQIEII